MNCSRIELFQSSSRRPVTAFDILSANITSSFVIVEISFNIAFSLLAKRFCMVLFSKLSYHSVRRVFKDIPPVAPNIFPISRIMRLISSSFAWSSSCLQLIIWSDTVSHASGSSNAFGIWRIKKSLALLLVAFSSWKKVLCFLEMDLSFEYLFCISLAHFGKARYQRSIALTI